MTKEKLIELVVQEATLLREKATPEELNNLNFDNLTPSSSYACIYGQMTGDCTSKRAEKLIKKCCSVVLSHEDEHVEKPVEFYKLIPPKGSRLWYRWIWFSPIEVYISQDDAKSKNLIAFLKGETDKLEL